MMALERAKVELEARNRQLESAARGGKEAPSSLAAPGTSSQVRHRLIRPLRCPAEVAIPATGSEGSGSF